MSTRSNFFPLRFSFRVPESAAAYTAAAPEPAGQRFTLDGSDDLEMGLDRICQQVVSTVVEIVSERKIDAILLGGGYGRGEGGVLQTTEGERPYNDMEFYVCLRSGSRLEEKRIGAVLHEAARELTPVAGVDLELKVCSSGRLRRSPPSMFYYDLVMGHHRLFGGEQLLRDCEHHRDAARIPPQ